MRITLIGYIFIRPENAVRPGGGSLQNTININVLTRQKKCYVCVFCICTICLFANSDKINNTKKKKYSQNRHFSFPSSKIRFIEQNFFRAFAAAFAKFASGIIFFFYIRSFRILLLCLSIFFFRKKNLIFFSEHQFDINLNYIVWMTCWLDRVRIKLAGGQPIATIGTSIHTKLKIHKKEMKNHKKNQTKNYLDKVKWKKFRGKHSSACRLLLVESVNAQITNSARQAKQCLFVHIHTGNMADLL